ncbi:MULTISPECIES: hypothetical protein [unclassified Chryseobacterium]|uniref:hypothetical protein n=1 Tax=unclassified Chryseobacterium TaxID=2593645 RepID=UPI000D353F08|nr:MULTISPECIES: hypothetical protein [unclassified Chryseobacterium]PTT70515.1 hypothetical protein DBR25_18250 [Chryseobacterium sp. HMWF001]PVV61827.1 hypothetical protein DD829_01100 [Chryseobacterium sp. HMWF035]
MKLKFIFILISFFLYSCKKENKNMGTVVKSNTNTEVSTDINSLQKLINLSKFRPEKVKFKYIFIDNSEGRIPGPSDSFLEAVICFDEQTMKKIWDLDKNADFAHPDYQKQDFEFDWLDEKIINELKQSDGMKAAHPDFIFDTENGKCWYLKNKILFIKTVN